MHIRHTARTGFTLIELMVVVSILAALAALVLVSVDSMNTASWHALDMSNQRSIARANIQHAEEHKGLLLHSRTTPLNEGEMMQFANDNDYAFQQDEVPALVERGNRRLWVRAYDDALATRLITVDPGEPAELKIEKLEALSDGEAWQYMDGNPATYKSPPRPRTAASQLLPECLCRLRVLCRRHLCTIVDRPLLRPVRQVFGFLPDTHLCQTAGQYLLLDHRR